jgi:hypothetical protein
MNTTTATAIPRSPRAAAASGDPRACAWCAHALYLRGETWCRVSAGAYPCSDERALSPLKAWALGACGRDGRFFTLHPALREARGPVGSYRA